MTTKSSKPTKCQTICWDCANATDEMACPWARDGTPVDGWWARKGRLKYGLADENGEYGHRYKYTETYSVIMCPLFKRDAWRAGLYKHDTITDNHYDCITEKDVKNLAASIIAQAIQDWKLLDYGKHKKMTTVENQTIKAIEVYAFFMDSYFEELLAQVSSIEPEKVRKILKLDLVNYKCLM